MMIKKNKISSFHCSYNNSDNNNNNNIKGQDVT